MIMMKRIVAVVWLLLASSAITTTSALNLPCDPTTDRHCFELVPKDTVIDDGQDPSGVLNPEKPIKSTIGPADGGRSNRAGLYGGVAAGSALLLIGAAVVAARRRQKRRQQQHPEIDGSEAAGTGAPGDRLPDAV